MTDLAAQVFSDREIVATERYAAGNVFAGIILVLIAILVAVEPRLGPVAVAVSLAALGLVMVAAVPVAFLRPRAIPALLFVHGIAFMLLALALAASSLAWALFAPPRSAFRYAPGLVAAVLTYGALQVGAFGPWRARARRVRIAGFAAGIVCEVALAIALLLRIVR